MFIKSSRDKKTKVWWMVQLLVNKQQSIWINAPPDSDLCSLILMWWPQHFLRKTPSKSAAQPPGCCACPSGQRPWFSQKHFSCTAKDVYALVWGKDSAPRVAQSVGQLDIQPARTAALMFGIGAVLGGEVFRSQVVDYFREQLISQTHFSPRKDGSLHLVEGIAQIDFIFLVGL